MQMDPKRFENTYTYHAPKGDQTARYEKLRAKARELAELIEESGFAPTVRGETLDIPSFASLANAIAERKG